MPQPTLQNGLDIRRLPALHKRVYIPEQADFNDPEQFKSLYTALLNRPLIAAEDLETFLSHRGELEAAVRQHRSVLYVQMTCQTDDAERAAAYRRFIEEVQPLLEAFTHRLNVAYLAARDRLGPGPEL
jgi:oligoendopeptidase F